MSCIKKLAMLEPLVDCVEQGAVATNASRFLVRSGCWCKRCVRVCMCVCVVRGEQSSAVVR